MISARARADQERRGKEAFARLKIAAAAGGLKLLTRQWHGSIEDYRFRCGRSHEFRRSATVLMCGGNTCPQCERERMQHRFDEQLAAKHVTCLETGYLGPTFRHRLQCEQGHTWEAEGRKVLEGHGCKACTMAGLARKHTRADGLDRMQRTAAEWGGRCLADQYLGTLAAYEWECAQGHRWTARAARIRQGSWCPACFHDRQSRALIDPNGLERLMAAATEKGGECLASVYESQNVKYRFRCALGHEWRATGAKVLLGSWCPQCGVLQAARTHLDPEGLQKLQAVAQAHGGGMEEQAYRGLGARYHFQCARGHRWSARGNHILEGNWCRACAGLDRRNTLERMQQVAHERGGRCLSPVYESAHVKLTWECDRGHVWVATPDSILNGKTWCPNCAILERTGKQHLRRRYEYEGRDQSLREKPETGKIAAANPEDALADGNTIGTASIVIPSNCC